MAGEQGQSWHTGLLSPSLFPVSKEQEVRKHLRYGLLITGPNSQQNMETGEMTTFHLLLFVFHVCPRTGLTGHKKNKYVHSNQCKICVYVVLSKCFMMTVCMCVDVDECVEGQHQCQQRCINTFGSFKCSCDDGYQPAHDQTCTGVCVCVCVAMHLYIRVC